MSEPNPEQPGRRSILARLRERRGLRRCLFVLACLATIVALFYAEENWRGRHAWLTFKREWEAKGERFELAAFIPKAVPADQNFAMTPLLAPLLDYRYTGKPKAVHWRDPEARGRTTNINIYGPRSRASEQPVLGGWDRAKFIDLAAWQTFYRNNTNFPSSPQSQGPAQDVLLALSTFDPLLNELREANHRPAASFPVHYDEGAFALLPHLAVFKAFTLILQLRAVAGLEANRANDALQDIELGLRLAETIKPEPLLISQLVRVAIVQIMMQPVWEGLVRHRWSEQQLEELQRRLGAIQLLEDYGVAMRGERALGNELVEKYRAGQDLESLVGGDTRRNPFFKLGGLVPSGWFYRNQLFLNRLFQQWTLPVVDLEKRRVYPQLASAEPPELKKPTLDNAMARLLFPAVSRAALKLARGQTVADLATVACALERYRLAQGRYPDALDALTPRFLARIPSDLFAEQPLRYRRGPGDVFVLYSFGSNERDDNGEIVRNKSNNVNLQEGDWVWPHP